MNEKNPALATSTLSTATPEDMGGISPELMQQIIGLGSAAQKRARLTEKLRGAQAAKAGGPGPEGRSYGGVYVAANPLEHLAGIIKQGIGGMQERESESELEGLGATEEEAKKAYLAQILRGFRTQNPNPQVSSNPNTYPGEGLDTY